MSVLVADPYRLTLDSIRETLDASGWVEVLGEAMTGAELLGALKLHHPDVVLVDLDMPDMDGFTCLELIRENHPKVKVIVLAAEREPPRIERAL
ncbi:MAG: response regulator transcription factor, partial [Actinomycetota bacterium]|nr:response regulator transcription factor [Actinomycetota bacterium]